VNLLGVDSVNLPLADKQRVWNRLAKEWKLQGLEQLETVVNFQGLDQALKTVLRGDSRGRLVLDLSL
jgi:acrylyl-CoA reductase (NADPH)